MPIEDGVAGGELCFLPAREQRARIETRDVSARELLEAHLARIDAVNPRLNAIVTLAEESAREAAREADERQAAGRPLGPLHGLPIAYKDLTMTAGIRSTMGSPLLEHHVPASDDLIVTRLRAAGAITIGKTNTPEFGAGSQTFNPVFGATRNPYDPTKTCGGSSGGAAVALATGMLPIADGSDMGGSLRNPASYCNVFGFRPSAGRVPIVPARNGWASLGVLGPMARTVGDAALVLSAMAGPDPRAPLSLPEPGASFARPLERAFAGVRVAWATDLGGLPFDSRVLATVATARAPLSELGCIVEDAEPDLAGADAAFQTQRSLSFLTGFDGLGDEALGIVKDTVREEVRAARTLTAQDVVRAEHRRTELHVRLQAFFERFEFLVAPVTQVPPFDVETPYPTTVAGVAMSTYTEWMRSCSRISATGHPAASVPCGFTDDGLPVGLQIVGRYRDDWGVLQLAHAFEQATHVGRRRPPP